MVKKLFYFLEALDRVMMRMEKTLIIVFLAGLVTVAFAQVVMRNFFHLGYLWVDEGIRVMVLWLAFMGAGIASEYARHIRVDILMYALTERQKQIVDVLANIFIIGVCMGFLVAALRHIQFQMASTVQLVLTGVPDWATSLVIPYFFVITAFRALLHINRDLRGEKQEELPIAANESVAWGTGE